MTLTIIYLAQEGARAAGPLVRTPQGSGAEEILVNAVQWLRLAVETMGALVISLGIIVAATQFVGALLRREHRGYEGIRLTLARYLALALEFQLGADILSTAIAPSWDQIGKLGAIAVIRTGLNYFLMREMTLGKSAELGGEGGGSVRQTNDDTPQ